MKLKGACFLATKSHMNELDASTSICYALVCKKGLFLLVDISSSLPLVAANLLHEYTYVFPKELPLGLPPIRGIEHQVDLIPRAYLPNRDHT